MPYFLYSFALVVLLTIFAPVCAVADGGGLKVNTSIKPPFSTHEETGFFDLLVKELGRRTGVEVELVRLPAERALLSVDQGVSHAELPRIGGLDKQYRHLVMVDEKLIDYDFIAFKRSLVQCGEWKDLEEKRVGLIIGWKIFESNVPRSTIITRVCSPDQLFQLLEGGRIDMALYERYAGRAVLKEQGRLGVRECETPLAVRPMYMYLHESRADLAPELARHLREMKADGTYQKFFSKTLEQ